MPILKITWFFLLSMLIIACTGGRAQTVLPTPERDCPITLNWHGIVPGESTQKDVLKALGMPLNKGRERIDDYWLPFYEYKVQGGHVADFVSDRVFFRSDGTVDWIEAVVADRDETFHPVGETISELGDSVDTVYVNNNYRPSNSPPFDIQGGPDQLYVWSECGIAVHALSYCLAKDGALNCPILNKTRDELRDMSKIEASIGVAVTVRHPDEIGPEPVPGFDNAVLMKFIFPSTSYSGFNEHYRYMIPFGIWNEYLREILYE